MLFSNLEHFDEYGRKAVFDASKDKYHYYISCVELIYALYGTFNFIARIYIISMLKNTYVRLSCLQLNTMTTVINAIFCVALLLWPLVQFVFWSLIMSLIV